MNKEEFLERYGKEHEADFLWHCTRLDFVETILSEGLIAEVPEQREYKPKGIYLSEYRFNWMWNTTREGWFKGAAIKVDVSGLRLVEDFHLSDRDTFDNSKLIGTDFICLEDIGPDRIREVWIETKPQTFQRVCFPIVERK